MKAKENIKKLKSLFMKLFIAIAISITINACNDEVQEWDVASELMVITEYVYSEPELFSEFGKALQITGIENLLRVRGPYTLLLPTNTAMEEYYGNIGVSSIEAIEFETLSDFVNNHILMGPVSSGNMGLGTLPFKNNLDDFIASDLPGTNILLNKTATVIKRDIEVSNGYVHHIDKVLAPITKTIYEVLSEDGGYTIFKAGLDMCGLSDTLKVVEFPYGASTARTRYTLLAVPDTLYNREGINSIDDLVATYSTNTNYTDKSNGLYQYIEYHCLSGSNYFSDIPYSGIFYLISYDNYLSIRAQPDDYKINKKGRDYTGFYFDQSNTPAKNGVIHCINSQLPNVETEPAEVTLQTTDYFDLQQGSYYLNHYQRFYDGENTFEKIKWDAEFLLYYLKLDHFLMDDDALNLNGHFWIEITTPKIRKGKYSLSTFMFFGGGFAKTNCFLDGEFLGFVDPNESTWGGDPLVIGEVEFTETKEHTIKLQTVVPGGMFWDWVRFTPID